MPKPRKYALPPLTDNPRGVSHRITKYRKLRGLTQKQLAEKIGITRDLLSNCEQGRSRINDELIIRFAHALHVSPDELLGFSKDNHAMDDPPNVRFVRRMLRIAKLSAVDQKAILRTIDSFLQGAESRNK
jgi:transcriptional regulator with XRE-family HTH domain